jgi:hypothetical protein
MKRLAFFILFAFLTVGTAQADSLNVYLGTTDSGNTTVASGTSTMVIEGMGVNRSVGVTVFDASKRGPYWGAQLMDLDSSQAQQGLGGTISKNFDFFAECSLDDVSWTDSEKFYFYKNETATATTNNTAGPVWRKLPAYPFVRFGFVTASGTTVFDHAKVRVFPGKDGNFKESPPALVMTAYPGNANSGVSSHTVSEGVRWIAFEYGGDNIVSLRIDGTTVTGTGGGVYVGSGYSSGKVWEPQPGEILYWNMDGAVTPYVTEAF